MKEKIASILFSTRLTAVLFVLFPTAMGIGTFMKVGTVLILPRYGSIMPGGLKPFWR